MQIMERQGTRLWLSRFLWRSVLLSCFMLLVHTGCFVAFMVRASSCWLAADGLAALRRM